MAANDAMPSHASWVLHKPARAGCSAVLDAMVVIPTAASASAAAIVGTVEPIEESASQHFGARSRLTGAPGARGAVSGASLGGSLSLEEDLEDVAHDGRCRRSAMAAVLDHDREGDLGLFRGRIADEPRVIALVLRLFVGVDAHRFL